MNRFRIFNLFALFLFAASPLAHSSNRDTLTLQGIAHEANGDPVDGSHSTTFRIYDSSSGSSLLWEETQTISFLDGQYGVTLGSSEPFPDGLFENDDLFLGVQIGSRNENALIPLRAVPWVKRAAIADVALQIADGAVTADKIGDDQITSAAIATGAVGSSHLSATGVTPGTYTLANITVGADGRITAASDGAGGTGDITGITGLAGGGLTGDLTLSIGAGAVSGAMFANGTLVSADFSGTAGITDAQVADTLTFSDLVAGSSVVADSEIDNDLTVNGGTLNNSVIGGSAPAAGTFTTLRGTTSAILEDPAGGTNTITIDAPDGLAAGYALELPGDDGDNNEALATNGSGVLTWETLGTGGGDVTSVVANSGLSGGGNSGSVTVSVGNLSVTGAMFANGTLVSADFSGTAGITDAQVSNTLTLSNLAGSGSTSNAVDLATAEANGALADANVADTLTIGASSTVANGALSANVSLFGTSIDGSEITDNTVTASDLAASLAFADGAFIDLSAINASSATEGLILPQANDVSAATAEGQTSWDANDDILYIGNGAGVTSLGGALGASIESAEITDGTITGTDIADNTITPAKITTGGLSDAQVSDTLTLSNFVGTGSTTDAVDLGTAEVAGALPPARLNNIMPHPITNRVFGYCLAASFTDNSLTCLALGAASAAGAGTPVTSASYSNANTTVTVPYIGFPTTASNGAYAGQVSSALFTRPAFRPRWSGRMRTSADLTEQIMFFGGFDSGTTNGPGQINIVTSATAGSEIFAAIGYNVTVDTELQCCSGDGSNYSCSDMGVTVATDTEYALTVDWSTSGSLVCTANGTSVTKTTNLAADSANVSLGWSFTLRNTPASSAIRSIGISRVMLDQN